MAAEPTTADGWKVVGNVAFAAADYAGSIAAYGAGLLLDGGGPAAAVLLSNRAAAYLARGGGGDALAALSDASGAIRLKPDFAKAHGRRGSALLLLGQAEEAYAAFAVGLRAEPTNASLRDGMAAAQAALSAARDRSTYAAVAAPGAAKAAQPPAAPAAEEDELASFLNDVEGVVAEVDIARKAKEVHAPLSVLTEADRRVGAEGDSDSAAAVASAAAAAGAGSAARASIADIFSGNSTALIYDRLAQAAADLAAESGSGGPAHLSSGREYELQGAEAEAQSKTLGEADLGDSDEAAERLTGKHAEWFNLNPFDVLRLPHTANEDDIARRYRRISGLVHPDKCRHERASDAFQAVKKAYDALQDPNKRRLSAALIHNVLAELKKTRKKRGTWVAESEEAEVLREVRKAFADVEQRRRNYEARIKAQAEREATAAADAHEAQVEAAKSDVEWAKGRDERKANWHSFEGPEGKRRKMGDGGLHSSDAMRFGAGTSHGPEKRGAGEAAPPEHKKKWR
jgi:DnaJ family protein C protein 8